MRYAIYYTPPPGSDLHRLGTSWLGRDVHGQPPGPQPPGLPDATSLPAFYGFHATLKPPFRLADNTARDDLGLAVAHLAEQHQPVTIAALDVTSLDGFLALVPAVPSSGLQQLADDCVRMLDGFRHPPEAAELARRREAGLSARQDGNLRRWGYPYVFEDFRFHMTLTGRLADAARAEIARLALAHFQPVLGKPVTIDALTILRQNSPKCAFVAEERVALRANTARLSA